MFYYFILSCLCIKLFCSADLNIFNITIIIISFISLLSSLALYHYYHHLIICNNLYLFFFKLLFSILYLVSILIDYSIILSVQYKSLIGLDSISILINRRFFHIYDIFPIIILFLQDYLFYSRF